MDASTTNLQDLGLPASTGAASKAIGRSRGKLGRILKYSGFGLVGLLALALLSNWLWTMSGSNQWELKIDEEGTQIYTLKSPGAALLKTKGVWHSKEFTLNHHLAPFFDESIQEDCGKWLPECLNYRILESWDPKTERNITMWTLKLPGMFAPREILLEGRLYQDPVTKVVTIENIAVPNSLPRNDCCVRIEHFHNIWHFTPLADGTIRVEFLSDWEMGGAFPTLLLNLAGPGEVFKALTRTNPEFLRQEKFRNARFDFIDSTPAQ